jgi:fatty-acyl-CoA synthase
MIIRGGENIYPREIEDLLFTHPDVAEAAVVGVPDPRWGEVVAAFIRPAPGSSRDETALREYCRAHLALYKCAVRWIFLEAFPLTPSGKIQKFKLREMLDGVGSAVPDAVNDAPRNAAEPYAPGVRRPLPR